MITIPLFSQDIRDRAFYLSLREIPDNYMEDFTLLGLIVDHYQEARDLLSNEAYPFCDKAYSLELHLNSPADIRSIKKLFETNGITCTMSDIADSLYQA